MKKKKRKHISESLSGAKSGARSTAFPEEPADYKETRAFRIRAASHSRGVSERVNHTARGDRRIMPSLRRARRRHQAAWSNFSPRRRHFKESEPPRGDAGALRGHPPACSLMSPLRCSLDWVIDFQKCGPGTPGGALDGEQGGSRQIDVSVWGTCALRPSPFN